MLITFTCHYIHVVSELIFVKYIFDIFTGMAVQLLIVETIHHYYHHHQLHVFL